MEDNGRGTERVEGNYCDDAEKRVKCNRHLLWNFLHAVIVNGNSTERACLMAIKVLHNRADCLRTYRAFNELFFCFWIVSNFNIYFFRHIDSDCWCRNFRKYVWISVLNEVKEIVWNSRKDPLRIITIWDFKFASSIWIFFFPVNEKSHA